MVCRARAVTPMEIRAQAGGRVGLLLDVFGLGSLQPQAGALVNRAAAMSRLKPWYPRRAMRKGPPSDLREYLCESTYGLTEPYTMRLVIGAGSMREYGPDAGMNLCLQGGRKVCRSAQAHRVLKGWIAKSTAVITAKLGRAFIADAEARICSVHALQNHQPARLL